MFKYRYTVLIYSINNIRVTIYFFTFIPTSLYMNMYENVTSYNRSSPSLFRLGVEMEIFAITEGRVLPYLLDPEFESKLPIIPSEVTYVNFTWKSGVKKYYYNFYRLKSFDETILKTPYITIKTQGRVPKRPKGNLCLFIYRSIFSRQI